MAIVTTDDRHYHNIADTIREKANVETTYTPEEMPDGIAEVYEAGKKAEHDRFWNSLMSSTSWSCRFYGPSWHDGTFRPSVDIRPTGSAYSLFDSSELSNFAEILDECGVIFDTSGITTRIDKLFNWCTYIKHIPHVDVRNASWNATTGGAYIQQLFYACRLLHTIDGLHLRDDGTDVFNATFGQCYALENLTIYGTIGQNGLGLSESNKLTYDSLMSVIYALQDKTSVGGTWTVTLGLTNLAKLTDEEKAIATQKGWTLA